MLDLFLRYLPVIANEAMTVMYMLGIVTGTVFIFRTRERLGAFGVAACVVLAVAFALLAISAGDKPVYPRYALLVPIRISLLVGALLNITSHILYLLCFVTVRKREL